MRKKEEADKQAAADARFAAGRAPEPGIPEGGPSSSSGMPSIDEENIEDNNVQGGESTRANSTNNRIRQGNQELMWRPSPRKIETI